MLEWSTHKSGESIFRGAWRMKKKLRLFVQIILRGMKNSKLVKAVAELSAWELRHLSDFVHSPFFNKHERLSQLMDIVVAAAPDYDAALLDRHAIYRQLFPENAFDEQKFKDLLSLGMKLFKSYLTFYKLRQDEFAQGLALLEALEERKWEGEFHKTRIALDKTADSQPGQLQEKQLRHLRLQEAHINLLGAAKDRKADDTVFIANNLLDTYYLVYRLKLAVEMANRRNVVGQEFDLGMLAPLLDYLAAHPQNVDQNPGVRIYLLLYRLLTEADGSATFEALAALLQRGITAFHLVERREIYGYTINFCIQQVNRGHSHYLSGMIDLYQNALDDETLLNEGWLSQWDYKNIVTSGLKAKRFDWCERFIEQYKTKIEPGSRDNAYTYNLASLHLEQGNYKQALKLLQHVEFSDQFYHLGAKVMLLKSYYELQEHEALLHLCETFRMYLKRNTDLSKYHQTINMNLIALTRKLADIQSRWPDLGRKDRALQLARIKIAIEEKGNVAQKAWLEGKVAELVV
jgi:hypothetical protein